MGRRAVSLSRHILETSSTARGPHRMCVTPPLVLKASKRKMHNITKNYQQEQKSRRGGRNYRSRAARLHPPLRLPPFILLGGCAFPPQGAAGHHRTPPPSLSSWRLVHHGCVALVLLLLVVVCGVVSSSSFVMGRWSWVAGGWWSWGWYSIWCRCRPSCVVVALGSRLGYTVK